MMNLVRIFSVGASGRCAAASDWPAPPPVACCAEDAQASATKAAKAATSEARTPEHRSLPKTIVVDPRLTHLNGGTVLWINAGKMAFSRSSQDQVMTLE